MSNYLWGGRDTTGKAVLQKQVDVHKESLTLAAHHHLNLLQSKSKGTCIYIFHLQVNPMHVYVEDPTD